MAQFLLDHNVARELGGLLSRAGHGARSAQALGMARAGDEEYLLLAARSGWTVLTHNAKDFLLLHAAWRHWSRDWGVGLQHAGILVLIPPVTPAEAAREVLSLLGTGTGFTDAAYVWRRRSGWERRP